MGGNSKEEKKLIRYFMILTYFNEFCSHTGGQDQHKMMKFMINFSLVMFLYCDIFMLKIFEANSGKFTDLIA